MMNVFAKAAANQPLTPGQRAFLKLVEGFVLAGIVAALPVVAQVLGEQNVNWSSTLRVALATFGTAALMAAVKYCKAQGDPPLADALTAVADGIGQWAGLNDVGNKPAVTPVELPAPAPAAEAVPATVAAGIAGTA